MIDLNGFTREELRKHQLQEVESCLSHFIWSRNTSPLNTAQVTEALVKHQSEPLTIPIIATFLDAHFDASVSIACIEYLACQLHRILNEESFQDHWRRYHFSSICPNGEAISTVRTLTEHLVDGWVFRGDPLLSRTFRELVAGQISRGGGVLVALFSQERLLSDSKAEAPHRKLVPLDNQNLSGLSDTVDQEHPVIGSRRELYALLRELMEMKEASPAHRSLVNDLCATIASTACINFPAQLTTIEEAILRIDWATIYQETRTLSKGNNLVFSLFDNERQLLQQINGLIGDLLSRIKEAPPLADSSSPIHRGNWQAGLLMPSDQPEAVYKSCVRHHLLRLHSQFKDVLVASDNRKLLDDVAQLPSSCRVLLSDSEACDNHLEVVCDGGYCSISPPAGGPLRVDNSEWLTCQLKQN